MSLAVAIGIFSILAAWHVRQDAQPAADPAVQITTISTCFPTHHLVFAEDANNTLWTSAGGPQSGVIGWLNRKVFDETGDEVRSQGWTALVLDTNGNGKRDDYVEPDQPVTRAPFHVEGGKGTTSKVLHFQLRPDPLAR